MFKLHFTCLTLLCFIAILFFSIRKSKTKLHFLFAVLLIVSILEVIFDGLTLYTVNNMDTVNETFNRIAHRIFYALLVSAFYITYHYIRVTIEMERSSSIGRIPFIWVPYAGSLIAISLLDIEYIESHGIYYSMGPATYVIFIDAALYLILGAYYLVRYWNALPIKKRTAITAALTGEFVITLYQIIFPYELIQAMGVTLLNLGFFLTVESPDSVLAERLEYEKKRAELAEQDARAANLAKGRFLTNMSHEIRTPINAVLGMDEMIIRESREKSIRNYALDIKTAGNSLLSIINDILDFSKIESGKMEIIPVEYSLADMAADISTLIRPRLHKKSLEFIVNVDPGIPEKLIGDDMRIRQVLINLLTNAAKYTERGSVTISVKEISRIDLPERSINLFVEVKDTGSGIKEENIALLFEEFKRIEENKNRSIEGTGLGLNITERLLKLMNSGLKVSSVYGEGSSFSFEINQKFTDDTPIGDIDVRLSEHPAVEEYTVSFIAPDARILIVDDDEMNRRVFQSLIKETKIQITEANSGQAGIEYALQEHFDIIFMDHMMPGMDGIEAMKIIKSETNHPCTGTPIIVLTANAISGARESFLEEGFDDFLSKPIDSSKLEGLILRYLPKQHVMSSSQYTEETDDITYRIENQPEVELPIINGLDWAYARMHFTNDKLMFNILDFFCSSLENDAFELESYYNNVEEDFYRRHYQTKVHSMKSAAATIGIIPLSGMAKILEDASRTSDFTTLRTLHPIFIQKWLEYREPLAQFMQNSKPSKSPYTEKETVNSLIKQLHDAAEDMDIDLLDSVMSELGEYSFEGDDAVKIKDIKNAVRNFDVDFIMENAVFEI